MTNSFTDKADWRVIDPETLPQDIGFAYRKYREAYATAKALRETFEMHMTAAATLPATQRLVFGYNFGKLSIAIVANDKPAPKPTAQANSLAAFLASAKSSGQRI